MWKTPKLFPSRQFFTLNRSLQPSAFPTLVFGLLDVPPLLTWQVLRALESERATKF